MPTYYHYKPLQILSVSFSEDFEKAVQKLRRDFQARQTPLIEQRDQAPWDQLETLQFFWENVGIWGCNGDLLMGILKKKIRSTKCLENKWFSGFRMGIHILYRYISPTISYLGLSEKGVHLKIVVFYGEQYE